MKIKLQEALDLIQSADSVKLLDMDGYIVPHVVTESVLDEPENDVLFVSWHDDNHEFVLKANEELNNEVERDGHKITFVDTTGHPFELHLFREVPILP
jgi:hypothetical protein